MKTIRNHQNYSFVPFKLCKNYSVCISILLTFAILNLSVSCSYYTVKDIPTNQETISETVKNFNEQDKYAIMHFDDLQWHLKDIVVNEDEQTLEGVLVPVSTEHEQKVIKKNSFNRNKQKKVAKNQDSIKEVLATRDTKRVHRYKPTKKMPLNEVHFYLKDNKIYKNNENVSVPFSDVYRISINDKNTGRSIASVLAGTFGTIAFATLLVAALKSSCPFIYIKNGEEFDFIGELYPGQITTNMQKDDFLSLPKFMADDKNNYTIRITNQLKEIQHTDQVELITVNHEASVKTLLDARGNVQTFQNIIAPEYVSVDGNIEDIEPSLKKDNNFYAFNTAITTPKSTRNVVFKFNKTSNEKNAKLYLTAKNSVWLDYIFGKFNEQFGAYYNTFQKKQQKIEGDSIRNWLRTQNIPLSVYIKKEKDWELIEKISTVGPMAMRDMVVPFSLDGVNDDHVEIKLETGFMFWELDYVGIDFSENIELKPEYISPSKAIDQNGIDVTGLLTEVDNNYFVQPNIGDEVTVTFPASEKQEGLVQSVFLKNRGYYNYIRDYKGMPDLEKLKTFREPNVFTKYSEDAYFDFVNYNPKEIAYHE